ncbi:Oidioi.mRNA.OKI2018_I69.chr1.g2604.t1.cds [Oikopleura dioica]|uniref:Oidioi.mRNA.OKI2018_I69.chr1.g2604.t1.cds n=1 Tax=Oikopleura dioica TaxID=34765 RepID=A0ABN7SRL2_OIKDI|nr:Oidioi.mRNA.OKI2018_I69.chr1.g2604.t1.cds [Oikopleura dioica]
MDVDEASTSTAKMAKIESFESIYPGVLVSYGKFGKCHGSQCDGVPFETWPMEGRNFCEVCATKEYGSDFKNAKDLYSEISDAKLKCPAFDNEGSCKSEDIDIWEFYRGSCCEPASKVLTENKQAQEKQLKVVNQFYKDDFHSLQGIEDSHENTKNIIEKTEERLKREEMALKKMMEKVEKTKKYLETQKNNYEAEKKSINQCEKEKNESLKRFRQLSYEYHSVAAELSLDDEVEAKENRKQYLYCRVCGEFYNDTDRRKSFLTKCGHVACLKCFKDDFTDDIDHSSCPWHIRVMDCENEYYQHDVKTLYE